MTYKRVMESVPLAICLFDYPVILRFTIDISFISPYNQLVLPVEKDEYYYEIRKTICSYFIIFFSRGDFA